MTNFIRNTDLIRNESGAHVLVVHHSGKNAAHGARGHSALRAATDTEIEVTRDATSGLVTATVTKQRDRPGGSAFTFKLEPVEIGMDEDEEWIKSCVVVPVDGPTKGPRPKLTGPGKIAFELLVRAIDQTGELLPASNHTPPNKRGVRLEIWRQYSYSGGVTTSDAPDAKRKAFVRASQRLIEMGMVGIWGDWAWITEPDKAGQKPDNSVRE